MFALPIVALILAALIIMFLFAFENSLHLRAKPLHCYVYFRQLIPAVTFRLLLARLAGLFLVQPHQWRYFHLTHLTHQCHFCFTQVQQAHRQLIAGKVY